MPRRRSLPHPPPTDAALAAWLVVLALLLAGRVWLAEHPQHNPWAPLDLRDERGWATATKLAALRSDPEGCRAVLARSEIVFASLEPTGEGECRREDRLTSADLPLSPARPQMTCPVAAGLALWIDHELQSLAEAGLGSRIERIEQLGTFACRRLYGAQTGGWSEHATGNAIDVAAFVLADGRRVSVLRDWDSADERGAFLHAARDAACGAFGTVLSPDYNRAHADHFHLDQGRPASFAVCR